MKKNAEHGHPLDHSSPDGGEELLGHVHDDGNGDDEEMFGADHAHLFSDHKSDDDLLRGHLDDALSYLGNDGAEDPADHHPVAGEIPDEQGLGELGLDDLHEGHNDLGDGMEADVHHEMNVHLPPHNDIAGDLPVDIEFEGEPGDTDDLSDMLHGHDQGGDFDEMTFDGSQPDGQDASFDESQGHVDNLHMHPDDDTDDLSHLL